jgi:hypothetical protein
LYITKSNSKSFLIAEKVKLHLNSIKINSITNKRQFFSFLRELTAKEIISEVEYSYCLANYYKIVLELKFYHLLMPHTTDKLSGFLNFWKNVTEELIIVYSKESTDISASRLKDIINENLDDMFIRVYSETSQDKILSPFSKAIQNIEDLNDPELVSYSHFQESIQETQKILFELKELLSLSGIVSPVLYEITKVAREIPRNYTNKTDLIYDLKEKISHWEERLKKILSKEIKKIDDATS